MNDMLHSYFEDVYNGIGTLNDWLKTTFMDVNLIM